MSTGPVRIHAHNPGPYTGDGNNTWLLDGAEPALIDAGTGVAAHLDEIARVLDGRPLARLLVTHGHSDHASGVPAIRTRWPEVEVAGFPAEGRDWTPLHDGQAVRSGDRVLTSIHTPGHAADHLCFWDAARRELYGGDMVVWPGSVLIPAGRGGNLRDYVDSLTRIAALGPVRIYPGHGGVIEEPLAAIASYLEHRRNREAQILARVVSGMTTVDAIVADLYVGLPENLVQAARMTVQAHLDKLRDEGRIS